MADHNSIATTQPQAEDAINTKQVGGSHYTDKQARCPHCDEVIQHWDLFATASHLVGSATKYLIRFDSRSTNLVEQLKDLFKGRSYVDKMISIIQADLKREEAKPAVEEVDKVWSGMNVARIDHNQSYADPDAKVEIVDSSEQAVDVEAQLARERADAFANNKDVGPTKWQQKHPGEPTGPLNFRK